MNPMAWLLAVALAGVLLAWPEAALACPSCFVGAGKSRGAYFATFLFMTAAPLVAVGVLILWLHRRQTAAHKPGRVAR